MTREWNEEPSFLLQEKALLDIRNGLREKNLFEGEGIRPDIDLGEPTEEVDVFPVNGAIMF